MNEMNVVFGKPYILQQNNGNGRLCSDIAGLMSETFTLWFEVSEEYSQYLCTERCDAFIVGMLPYLMSHSSSEEPMSVTFEAPMSEHIYYQLMHAMIPTLTNIADMYSPINIICEINADRLPSANAVGTGVSGGVDSFYTLITNTQLKTSHYNITHGLYCDLAMYGKNEGAEETQRYSEADLICKEFGIKPVKLSSNICKEVYRMAHDAIVTFMFASTILSLQKLFSVYYISSGFSFSEFVLDPHSCPQFDLLNVYCFSNENLSLFTSGGEMERIEKVKRIADNLTVQNHLNVCVRPITSQKNCSKCSKCTRTILNLYANGDLDKFDKVFDINYFKENPNYYFGYLFMKGQSDHFTKEIFNALKKNGLRIPIGARCVGFYKFVKNGFHRTNPLAMRYRP